MELNVNINQQNIQVVEIERLEQEVIIQPQKQVIEVSPSFIREQPIHLVKSWFVINIDREDDDFYYIQSKLDNEPQYRIQRINKISYEIKYNLSTTNEWINRKELIYE